jgi:hypothetical protein
MSWERNNLRKHSRSQMWPETMLSPAVMNRDQVDELKHNVKQWTQALEDLDAAPGSRMILKHVPVDFALQQLVADALVSSGEVKEAQWALLLVVGAASPEKEPDVLVGQAQFAPPRVGWDDRCYCDLVKAQQCMRFGRLAVISAQKLSRLPTGQEYTPELCKLRENQRQNALIQEIASGQRHLVDARKLYKAELLTLEKLGEEQDNTPVGNCLGASERRILRTALRCGHLGATGLLASIYAMGGKATQAQATYEEALRESTSLLVEAAGMPLLRRLLTAEREKMQTERSKLMSS